ncbi:unnamed protein product [Rotaria sp. Silwood1]|nr:unnamed protein product [Rotaria sp. Silwood1]
MSHRTFLGAMLFLHKRVFGDKYDPIMINRKPCNTFLSIADYVNNGKVHDDENLIKKLHDFISNSLVDFKTCHGDQDGPGGQGGKGAIGGGKISV